MASAELHVRKKGVQKSPICKARRLFLDRWHGFGQNRAEMGQRFATRGSGLQTQPAEEAEVVALVLSGLDLVDRIARKLWRRLGAWLELEELLSAGREGLFDAARRFQRERGAPFSAYASVRIRGAMLDSARRMAGLPRRTYERALNSAALDEGTPEPTSCTRLQAWREHSDEAAARVRFATSSLASTVRLLDESRSAAGNQDPESALERAQLLALIRVGLGSLDAEEAELVRRHYFEEERLEDVANSLGITPSWASRILARAVARLTRQMRRRA